MSLFGKFDRVIWLLQAATLQWKDFSTGSSLHILRNFWDFFQNTHRQIRLFLLDLCEILPLFSKHLNDLHVTYPPSGQHGLLHNSFFQHDSELNTPMISTNIFFRKDDGIKIFDHQATSSEAVAWKCSVKKVFSNIS